MEEKIEMQKRESSDRGTERGKRLEGGKELEGGWVQRGEEELIGGFSLLAGGIRQPVQGLAIHHPPTASGSEIQHPPSPPPPPPPSPPPPSPPPPPPSPPRRPLNYQVSHP